MALLFLSLFVPGTGPPTLRFTSVGVPTFRNKEAISDEMASLLSIMWVPGTGPPTLRFTAVGVPTFRNKEAISDEMASLLSIISVPGTGLEPAHLAELEPESSVSTNFTIRAFRTGAQIYNKFLFAKCFSITSAIFSAALSQVKFLDKISAFLPSSFLKSTCVAKRCIA